MWSDTVQPVSDVVVNVELECGDLSLFVFGGESGNAEEKLVAVDGSELRRFRLLVVIAEVSLAEDGTFLWNHRLVRRCDMGADLLVWIVELLGELRNYAERLSVLLH